MNAPLRSPCSDDCCHPDHNPAQRITGQLRRVESEVHRLETINLLLAQENDRLNLEVTRLDGELLALKFNVQQHNRFAEVERVMTTQGDDLMGGYSDGLTA